MPVLFSLSEEETAASSRGQVQGPVPGRLLMLINMQPEWVRSLICCPVGCILCTPFCCNRLPGLRAGRGTGSFL